MRSIALFIAQKRKTRKAVKIKGYLDISITHALINLNDNTGFPYILTVFPVISDQSSNSAIIATCSVTISDVRMSKE